MQSPGDHPITQDHSGHMTPTHQDTKYACIKSNLGDAKGTQVDSYTYGYECTLDQTAEKHGSVITPQNAANE